MTNDLLSRKQAAKQVGIEQRVFNYFLQLDSFKQYVVQEDGYWLVNSDVIPLVKDYYSTIKKNYDDYVANEEYIAAHVVAKMLNITYSSLIADIQSGKWKGKYETVPKIYPVYIDGIELKKNYFFIRSQFLNNRYNTLRGIAKKYGDISRAVLRNYKKMGLLHQPAHLVGTNLYDEEQVIKTVQTVRIKQQKQADAVKENIITTSFSLLNKEQKKLITNYLNFRKQGGIVEYNGYRSTQQISNKGKTIEKIKQTLSSLFVLIISGRCGIEEDFHRNPFEKNEIPRLFNSDIFKVYDIKQDDYFYISSKRKGSSLILYYHELRTFYYYLLDKMEDEVIEEDLDFHKFTLFKRRVTKFLRQFPKNKNELNESDTNKKAKTFLTREQMVMVMQAILEDVRARDPFKNATMWRLSCTTGVRPEELRKLRIEHFLLDSEGYLKLNDRGWGELHLPANISKQENSPSHPEYHNPIPPKTVEHLNKYLSILYRRQGDRYPKGNGFFFRTNDGLPDSGHKSSITVEFINRLRPRLDFLDDVKKQDFLFKASRHSLNNLIMRSYIQSDSSLNGLVKRTVADHILRHKPVKTVGEEYYLDDVTKEQLYGILDATINFPWDLDKLRDWEIAKGYSITTDNLKIINQESMDIQKGDNHLFQMLEDLEKQLQEINQKPKGLTEQEWINKRQLLIKRKNNIFNQLKGDIAYNA